MSALGQKQTCAMHQPMSALPPIATAKADMTHRRRGTYQLLIARLMTISVGHARLPSRASFSSPYWQALFDHLVGGG